MLRCFFSLFLNCILKSSYLVTMTSLYVCSAPFTYLKKKLPLNQQGDRSHSSLSSYSENAVLDGGGCLWIFVSFPPPPGKKQEDNT